MLEQEKIELSKYRLEMAKTCVADAQSLFEASSFRSSANRSYYAIFHAMRAMLAMELLDFKKHSAVMGKFRELYIKTGVLDKRFSAIISDAFDVRGRSDYEDFYVISKESTEQQIMNAFEFITAVESYLNNRFADETAAP